MEVKSFDIFGIAVKHSKGEDKEYNLVESMKRYMENYLNTEVYRNFYLVQVYPEDFLSGENQRFVTFLGVRTKDNPSNKHLTKLSIPYSKGYAYTFNEKNSTKSIDEMYEEIYEELEKKGITLNPNYDFEMWRNAGDIMMYFPVQSENIAFPKLMSLHTILMDYHDWINSYIYTKNLGFGVMIYRIIGTPHINLRNLL